jgi:hypothetical protein
VIKPKRRAELDDDALAWAQGRIFGSWDLKHDGDAMVGMVFMPITFMKAKDRAALKRRKTVHVYEYVNKAGPRSVNGCPIFLTFRHVNAEEFAYMVARARAIHEAQQAAKSAPLPQQPTQPE